MPTSIGINSCLGFSLSVTGCCQGLFLPFQHCLKTPVLRTVGVLKIAENPGQTDIAQTVTWQVGHCCCHQHTWPPQVSDKQD